MSYTNWIWRSGIGRMVTTIGPWKRPAGRQRRLEMYIGTSVPFSTCRTLMPASIKPCSKVRLQPGRKATRSSRQTSRISSRCSTNSPKRYMRYPGRSVRRSAPAAERAGSGSPGGVISISGQGLGLRVQKAANSAAASFGRITRLACWWAGHCPPVLPRHSPRRAVARISAGEVMSWGVWPFRVTLHPSQRAGDQQLHDLVGAAIDLLHASVDKHAGDRELAHIAVAAVQLQAIVDGLDLLLAAPPLGHRRGYGVELALDVAADAPVDEDAGDHR